MNTILLVFVICYIQECCCGPVLFTGITRADLEDADETTDIEALKAELTPKSPLVVDKFGDVKKIKSWEAMNNIWKLNHVQVLGTAGYTVSTVASAVRENFWQGRNSKHFPLTISALKNAVCNNEFAKGLIAGKPPAYDIMVQFDDDGKEQDDVKPVAYDAILAQYKGKNPVFNEGFYPKFYKPTEAEVEFKFYFGMQETCPNQYVGDPNQKIHGPTSVSDDPDTAYEFAGHGYGTVFEITLYRDKANDIGGIIHARWLSLMTYENEWVIYDLGLKHIKIKNTDFITKVADENDPCYYSGTQKKWRDEENKRNRAAYEKKKLQREKEQQQKQKNLKQKWDANNKKGSGVQKKDKGGGVWSGISSFFNFKAQQVDFGDLVDDDGYMESRGETVGELDRMIEEEREVLEEEDYLRQILKEKRKRKRKRRKKRKRKY